MGTSWQFEKAWTAYNDQNVPQMKELSKHAGSLFLFGDKVLTFWKNFLDVDGSEKKFKEAAPNAVWTVLPGCEEGMVPQNASALATHISDFLKSKSDNQPEIV